MRIPALSRATGKVSRNSARLMGGAGSLAEAMAGRQHAGANRYAAKNTEPCTACSKGNHNKCFSLRCPCERCNPEVV